MHDALVLRAVRAAEAFGDDAVFVGPWRLRDPGLVGVFEDDPAFAAYASSCRALGAPVRVGRWNVPGRPRVILVDASGLHARRDDVLARLWEQHRVDSFGGDDSYVEAVLFGVAAGLVIDRFAATYVRPLGGETVVIANDATSGAALLDGTARAPDLGTVFVVHRTVVGHAIADAGDDPLATLVDRGPEGLAADEGLRPTHSLEAACVRAADVVVGVGETAAAEIEAIHGRRPTLATGAAIDADSLEASVETARRRASDRARGAYVVLGARPDARAAALSPRAKRHADDLRRLAMNLAWSWDEGAGLVLADLDPVAWAAGRQDPIGLLADAPVATLEALAANEDHARRLAEALERLAASVGGTPGAEGAPVALPESVAYFCAEFGVHASLPVYSGGLGILAGDHVKAASDRGLSFVAVGLFYRHGYVRQVVNEAGDQVPLAVNNDPRRLPMELVTDAGGKPVTVSVELPGTTIVLAAWRVRVGRVSISCSTRTCPRTTPRTAPRRRASTGATWRRGCGRRSSSASAACGSSTGSASSRP